MNNLCRNGTPITNSYHEINPDMYSPQNAFDGIIENTHGYSSHSYVYRYHPYIGYKFSKPTKILSMNLYQKINQRAYKVYIIYSDDGEKWTDAESFAVTKDKNVLQLNNDYGKHQYWAIQNRDGVTVNDHTNPDYLWTVLEIEMFGYDTSLLIQKSVIDTIKNNELFQKYCLIYDNE